MFSAKVYERLQNITYLSSLSKKNIAVISKPNDYGDTVKFMAQINKEDVIQKIRFKASGCSHFVALCSYFCEIVEGKSVTEAIKVKEKDLIKFDVLEESRQHVYPIILDTFALMIKRYRKGIEKGIIEPCEVIREEKVEKRVKKDKKININDGLQEILVSKKTKKTIENTENSILKDEIIVEEKKVAKKNNVSSRKEKAVEVSENIQEKQENANNLEVKSIENKSVEKNARKTSKKEVVDAENNIQNDNTKKLRKSKKSFIEETVNTEVIDVENNVKEQEIVNEIVVPDNKETTKISRSKKTKAEKTNKDKLSTEKIEKKDRISDVTREVVVQKDSLPSEMVVVEETPIVTEVESKPVTHTKVEHRKTITKQKSVQINNEIHTDLSVEHTELEIEHITQSDSSITIAEDNSQEIEVLDIPVIDIDETPKKKEKKVKEPKVKQEKPAKEKKEKIIKVKEKAEIKTGNTDGNQAKTEHLKKLQLGLATKNNKSQSANKTEVTQNKANNLNSMLSRLNAKHQEQGATTITTTHEKRVETVRTVSNKSTETNTVDRSSNLQSMRNSLLSLRSQNHTVTDNKEKVDKLKKTKNEKPVKEKKIKPEKPEKVRKVEKEVDEDGVEVVYLDDESKKDSKDKKGFFTRLFKK